MNQGMHHYLILWRPGKKKIDSIDITTLGLNLTRRLSVIEVNDPPERKAGIMVKDIDELMEKLTNEAKVI